jgi:hypothetical protein
LLSLYRARGRCRDFLMLLKAPAAGCIRGALAADDALEEQRGEPRFRVRDTSAWKQHADQLESEMLKRGMFFEVIDWSNDQADLPF